MNISVNSLVSKAICAHAAAEFPRESCGVVVVVRGKQRYIPCRNIAEGGGDFDIHPDDLNDAEGVGEVTHIVHSHPNMPALPTEADLVGCEDSELPWIIVNWPTGTMYEFAPSGYVAPLVGRSYAHGVLDCYSLIRDYYKRELDIDIPDFDRTDKWWDKGGNLYMENFEKAGFIAVTGDIQKHDVVLMQISSTVVNHGAIYIGDGLIMQHCTNRLSSRDVYGGYWQRCTHVVVRHRSLTNA